MYGMPHSISQGFRGHGPMHLLDCASRIGFVWNSDGCSWIRPGLGLVHDRFTKTPH